MSKYKVCVYAICKNEVDFVDRWMDSMAEADLIIVTDTGSDDGTVERLRERGAIVHVDIVKPWRFDHARNISLDHIPEDVDICVCTDLDEVFRPGWRAALEAAWRPDTTMAKYLYNWSLKPDGSPDVQFRYFKAHARKAYKWWYPVHECLRYIGEGPERIVYTDGMILDHYPDQTKSRGSYLGLLELGAEETPEDDRITYYLGREYMYKGMWEKCIETLKRHLGLKSATWREERCAAMRWIAKSYKSLERIDEAQRWYLRAIAECPHMRDAYVECAKMGYEQNNWPLTFTMIDQALRIKERSQVYVNMGYSWDYTPDDLMAISSYRLGLYEKALHHAKAALAYVPKDERLKNNLHLIESKCREENLIQ